MGLGNIIVSGPISLVKNGSFQLALGAANTYTGTNTLNGGTLLLTNVGTLGNAANPLFVNAGTLKLITGGGLASSGTINLAANTLFDVSALASFTINNGKRLTGSGTVTGRG